MLKARIELVFGDELVLDEREIKGWTVDPHAVPCIVSQHYNYYVYYAAFLYTSN